MNSGGDPDDPEVRAQCDAEVFALCQTLLEATQLQNAACALTAMMATALFLARTMHSCETPVVPGFPNARVVAACLGESAHFANMLDEMAVTHFAGMQR